MHIRPGVVAGLAGAACAIGLTLVPHALGGRQLELLQCLDYIPTLVGTPGDDVLTGTVGDDVIAGFGGNDVILGSWGNDVICGGDGNDRITTGVGLFDFDLVSGDAGDDHIVAAGMSTAVVYAFAPGPISADLQSGIVSGWGNDTLTGVHSLVGTEFDDVIRGNDRFNCLDGLAGDDVLLGLDGDDCLYGGSGDDSIDGGAGLDLVSFRFAPGPVRVNLVKGTATGEGSDRVASAEDVIGSSFADVLTGDAGTNVLSGEGGTDRLAGGPGIDRLDGGSGRDRVDGGIGRDQCLNAEQRLRCP